MQKILMLIATSLIITACSTVETAYKIGENGVETFMSKEKIDKLGLKEKNEFVKDAYETIKEANQE